MSINERVKYLEMKERHKNKLRPWYRKAWGIILILLAIIFIISLSLAVFYTVAQVKAIRNGQGLEQQAEEIKKITAAIDGRGENYSLGPIDAPVKVVIFSDYACPYCEQAAPVVKSLAQKYGDQVRITFRDYPLHENSVDLALAANCVGVQNKFWDMNDLLFDNQENLTPLQGDKLNARLKSLVKTLNIDNDKFASCLDDKTYLYRLNDDFADAELLGLSGTPTWFINRYKITGFYPEENFIGLIDGLLVQ